jgi:HAD superfamily hydrolase (TIGR01484 family)
MLELQKWGPESDSAFLSSRIWAFDLDDTLTEDGVLPAKICAALERLQSSGHRVVMVSGRPASWAQPFAKILPFDAVVAENGAMMCFWLNGKSERQPGEEPLSLFWTTKGYVHHEAFLSSQDFADQRTKKSQVQQEVLRTFPQMRLATDQMYRFFDLAIDFAESVRPVRPLSEAQAVKKIFESRGAVAKVSSIHVNGWWGDFDKSLGLKVLLENTKWQQGFDTVLYFGDSPNDAPLFALAPVSFGVANLKDFESDKTWHRPTYMASQKSSRGVLEVIDYYFNKRAGS